MDIDNAPSIDVKTSTLNPSPRNGVKFFDIRCILHNQCNLRCKFCFETKEKGIRENSNINIDYIKKLPNEVANSVVPVMKKHDKNEVVIGLMGGELFSDNIPDSIFDVYREFLHELKYKLYSASSINDFSITKFEVYVVSNGIYTDHYRVERFLNEFSSKLVLSYDPEDRFTSDKHRQMWYDTFNYFNERGFEVNVSILFTKKNINAYMTGDRMFNSIPPDIWIVNHEYFPRLDYEEYLPNDDDIYNFYKWCIDNNKFNVGHIYNMIQSMLNGYPITTCYQKSDYMFGENFDKKYGRCYINQCAENPLSVDQYYGKYAKQIIDDTDCLKYKQPIGLQKRGCLYCQYYSYCPKMCWSQIAFDKYQITQCPIQRVYEYIDNSRDIMNRFEKWSDDIC